MAAASAGKGGKKKGGKKKGGKTDDGKDDKDGGKKKKNELPPRTKAWLFMFHDIDNLINKDKKASYDDIHRALGVLTDREQQVRAAEPTHPQPCSQSKPLPTALPPCLSRLLLRQRRPLFATPCRPPCALGHTHDNPRCRPRAPCSPPPKPSPCAVRAATITPPPHAAARPRRASTSACSASRPRRSRRTTSAART